MARCPDCNRFVAFDTSEPDADGVDVDALTLFGEVTVTRCCAECGRELRQGTVDVSAEIPEHHEPAEDGEHELEVEAEDCIATSRIERRITLVGASVTFVVRCTCGWEHRVEWSGEVDARELEEV